MSDGNKIIIPIGLLVFAGLFCIWKFGSINIAWSEYLVAIQSTQRGLHLTLSTALRTIKADGYEASLTLIGLSFIYGVFHAAGPGHGKIIISTYLFSHESQLKRGILLSFSSSIAQGFTAIFIVTIAILVFDYTMRQTQGVANILEIGSFALIMVVGFFIFFTRSASLVKSFRGTSTNGDFVGLDHSPDCSHQHGPKKSDLENPLTFKTFVGIVASIGIRPCSGALIVLLLSYSLNIPLAGIFSVLAMSIGTALTVSLLAVFSVYLRQLANRFVGKMPNSNNQFLRFTDLLSGAGGLVIFVFGLSLLSASLFQPLHPFR
ncbi:nickel/cobalt transporter [Candidatus Puniceispirillum sp.]|nr:nickel/cobalt transporter [Candidatus Puniceispirillum sp.]